MLPLNYAIGVDGGMDFIIKTVQLGIEKHISVPQSRNDLPSRAAVFLDLKNMFNNISCEELMNIITEDYPELLAIINLLYHDPGVSTTAGRMEPGGRHTWRSVSTKAVRFLPYLPP